MHGCIKAPNQDLCFLEALKEYEKVDATSSKASISKFVNHLWYLCEEAVMLLFDDEVDSKTKTKMINNLNRDESSYSAKRFALLKKKITQNLFSKLIIFLFLFSKYHGLVFANLNCFFFLLDMTLIDFVT